MWWILFFLGVFIYKEIALPNNFLQSVSKSKKNWKSCIFLKKTSVLCFHQTQMNTFSWSMNFVFYYISKQWVVCGRRKLFGHIEFLSSWALIRGQFWLWALSLVYLFVSACLHDLYHGFTPRGPESSKLLSNKSLMDFQVQLIYYIE